MSKHSIYALSEVKSLYSTHVEIKTIHELLSESAERGNSRRYSIFFELIKNFSRTDRFLGRLVKYRSKRILLADPEEKKTYNHKEKLFVVEGSPRFLCLALHDKLLISHRARDHSDRDNFRAYFKNACKQRYELSSLLPSSLIKQLSELNEITDIRVKMENVEGKSEAVKFIKNFCDLKVFDKFGDEKTFNELFSQKIWHEKPDDKSHLADNLLKLSKEYCKFLEDKHITDTQHIFHQFLTSNNTGLSPLRRIEAAALLAIYCKNFSCKIEGHRRKNDTQLFLVDYGSVKGEETVFYVDANRKVNDDDLCSELILLSELHIAT